MMSEANEREAGISGSMLARTLGILPRQHLELLVGKYAAIPNVERLHRNTLVTLLVAQDSPDLKMQVLRVIGRDLGVAVPGATSSDLHELPAVRPSAGRPPGSRNRPK